jgi:hypothetical protein
MQKKSQNINNKKLPQEVTQKEIDTFLYLSKINFCILAQINFYDQYSQIFS